MEFLAFITALGIVLFIALWSRRGSWKVNKNKYKIKKKKEADSLEKHRLTHLRRVK
jgi:hypothetical protein